MTELDGAVVVVTGASGGIGQAVSAWLRNRGAVVFDLDVRPPAGPDGTSPPDGAMPPDRATLPDRYVPVDVLDPTSVEAAVRQVQDRAGRIDGLVAAAGVSEEPVPAEEMDLATWDRTVGINLRGAFLTCQRVGRVMLAQGHGSIVTVASMSGNHVVNVPQQQVAYNSSKAGLVAMTRSLALEWAQRGVRVNALSPGYVDTPLLGSKTHLHAQWTGSTPLGRFARPAEVAAAVGWLLSEESSFCCGTELLMDGGYSLP